MAISRFNVCVDRCGPPRALGHHIVKCGPALVIRKRRPALSQAMQRVCPVGGAQRSHEFVPSTRDEANCHGVPIRVCQEGGATRSVRADLHVLIKGFNWAQHVMCCCWQLDDLGICCPLQSLFQVEGEAISDPLQVSVRRVARGVKLVLSWGCQ